MKIGLFLSIYIAFPVIKMKNNNESEKIVKFLKNRFVLSVLEVL